MYESKTEGIHPASFRDQSGFLYHHRGELLRQVNPSYRANFDRLIESGLFAALTQSGQLIAHEEVDTALALTESAYKVIKPERVPFISHPYEWCFSQLRNAALLSVAIQRTALTHGMSLKDCSAYNIQFTDGKPILIDTLSFERYREGEPWVAYRQFCQHFLAPLSLMVYCDVRLGQLLRLFIDGVPLDLTSRLLPARSRLNLSLLTHIDLHALSQWLLAGRRIDPKRMRSGFSLKSFLGLLDSLESAIRRLRWTPRGTEWAEYARSTHYSQEALEHKMRLVSEYLDKVKPRMVWDLGANIGLYSRIASQRGILTISFDQDPAAVEINYAESLKQNETKLLPLVLDLTNPSPGTGWENQERESLIERGPAEAVLALALLHHLVISNNLPLAKLARFFARIARWLIIEFVPKEDPQVQKMLSTRDDIFSEYSRAAFEAEFGRSFIVHASANIEDSARTMYLMKRRSGGA